MKFIKRLGFFSIGLVIGIVILLFFLGGKKTSCDYGLDSRVIKNISIKKTAYSQEALKSFKTYQIDTSQYKSILQDASVNFGESQTDLDSCRVYILESTYASEKFKLQIENCDSIAKVKSFQKQ